MAVIYYKTVHRLFDLHMPMSDLFYAECAEADALCNPVNTLMVDISDSLRIAVCLLCDKSVCRCERVNIKFAIQGSLSWECKLKDKSNDKRTCIILSLTRYVATANSGRLNVVVISGCKQCDRILTDQSYVVSHLRNYTQLPLKKYNFYGIRSGGLTRLITMISDTLPDVEFINLFQERHAFKWYINAD